jgi:hypothetical protein
LTFVSHAPRSFHIPSLTMDAARFLHLLHLLFFLSCICAFAHAYALHPTCESYRNDVVEAMAEAKTMALLGYDTILDPLNPPDEYDDLRSRLPQTRFSRP